MIEARQIRAARALLDWGQEKLAAAAIMSVASVKRLERGANTHAATVAAVQKALELAGVVFLEPGDIRDGGPGVRLKKR